jgi:ATP-dependent helicase Lhr and Lhr-like helicase
MQSKANLLNPLIQKWLNLQGWTNLHEVQENAIEPILDCKEDIIISAATASGKTEAAFLPACTKILLNKTNGIKIIYISPLKALINDQYKRIEALGHATGIPVTPWHGDIGDNKKQKMFTNPNGILLITPESLESLLINHKDWCKDSLNNLNYFIIDEFHAFIGTERGYQLLSQLHRLESMLKREVPRIALSATLSNIKSVKQWLRPNSNKSIKIIESSNSSKGIKLQIRGYNFSNSTEPTENITDYTYIAQDIFKLLRGSTNLVFANSRAKTEYLANVLVSISEQNHLPNEFFPHHGSLSKDLREQLENRLKIGKLPTTAVCTQTLELGIDLGDVTSIAQVNAPQSVASLRQRIGRSGRRNKDAILRLFIPEVFIQEGIKTQLIDKMRDQTFLSASMIELVLDRWFEPPTMQEFSFSTLIQQILSVIAQYGSVQALSIWKLLCKTGPFNLVNQQIFVKLLKTLGKNDLITQMSDSSITLGIAGEKLVSNYNFYSSFKSQEEYTVDNNGHKIGTIPLMQPLNIGDTFLFAGKGWETIYINNEKHQLFVKEYKENAEPLVLDGSSGKIHDGVREKMFELYCADNIVPKYLNKEASKHFIEGQKVFHDLNLIENYYIVGTEGIYLFPWKGDKIMHTIVQILKLNGIKAKKIGSYILLPLTSSLSFKDTVNTILNSPKPTENELSVTVTNLEHEKYDNFLDPELLCLGYGLRNFDVEGAFEFFNKVLNSHKPFDNKTGASYQT